MKTPTAKQTRWLKYIADLGCCVSNEDWRVQVHHCIGRTARVKINGVSTNIGNWFILPLAWRYHDVNSNDPLNVTHHKHAFQNQFGTEAELFNQCLNTLIAKARINKNIDSANFPPEEVVNAIMEWRR